MPAYFMRSLMGVCQASHGENVGEDHRKKTIDCEKG